jgi:hypothetical protein
LPGVWRSVHICHVTSEEFGGMAGVCTENLIRVDDVMESPKLAE